MGKRRISVLLISLLVVFAMLPQAVFASELEEGRHLATQASSAAQKGWSEAYKSYVYLTKYPTYTDTNESNWLDKVYVGSEGFGPGVKFALADINADGVPELLIGNNPPYDGMYHRSLVFTYKNGKVVYTGNAGIYGRYPDHISRDSKHPGIFETHGVGGSGSTQHWTIEGTKLVGKIIYTYDFENNGSGGIREYNIVLSNHADSSALYQAYKNSKIIQYYTLSNIKSMGWDKFIARYGYKTSSDTDNGANKKTGLYKVDGTWKYYENGKFTKATGLARRPDNGKWYYVKNGVFRKATGISKRLTNGKVYFVRNGVVSRETGMAKSLVNGKWYYVEKGAFKKATGLTKSIQPGKNKGKWFFVKKGELKKATGFTKKLNSTDKRRYYVEKGVFKKTTGKVKISGKQYVVKQGIYQP